MRKPYIVIAGSHDQFEKWLNDTFKYVGDAQELAKYDPRKVKQVLLIGNYADHPFYWSDDLLRFQIAIAAHQSRMNSLVEDTNSKPGLWDRFLVYFGLKGSNVTS